jgi:hypothetical protein
MSEDDVSLKVKVINIRDAQKYLKEDLGSKYIFRGSPDTKNRLLRILGSFEVQPRYEAFCKRNNIAPFFEYNSDTDFWSFIPADPHYIDMMVAEGFFNEEQAEVHRKAIREPDVLRWPGK